MHGQKDARELPKKAKGVKKEPFPRSSRKAENSRGGRQSGWRGDEFSPRVDAPISATGGQVLSFTRSEQLEQSPFNQIAETDLDACLLYRTLVKDGAIPEGWETDFMNLVKVARQAGDRQLRAFSQVKNEDASVWLHEYHERRASQKGRRSKRRLNSWQRGR